MLLKLPLYPRIIVVHGKIRSLRPDRSVLSQTHFSDHLTFHDQTVSREDAMPALYLLMDWEVLLHITHREDKFLGRSVQLPSPLLSPQILDASSFPKGSLRCLTSGSPLRHSSGPPPCTVIQKAPLKEKAEAHPICFPHLRDYSPARPVVQHPSIVASFILSGFLAGYQGEVQMKVKYSGPILCE